MRALNLRPSSNGIVVLAILAVVILFGCVLAYVAAAGKLKAATQELAQKERVVAEGRQMAQRLERSRLDYLDACAQVRYLEGAVSTREYVPTMLKQLEQMGRSVNLKVLGVRPDQNQATGGMRSLSSSAQAAQGNVQQASQTKAAGTTATTSAPVKQNPYDELKVNLELRGSYMNALDFMYKLTTFPKIVAVNTVEMVPVKDSRGLSSPVLGVKMLITAYILKDQRPNVRPTASSRQVVANGRYPI